MHLFEVKRPMVKIECAGHQLESEEIESYQTNPNFTEVARYIDVVSLCHQLLVLVNIKNNKSGSHFHLVTSTGMQLTSPSVVFGLIRSCLSSPTSILPSPCSWWSSGHSVKLFWSGPMWSRASWTTAHVIVKRIQMRKRKSQKERVRN